VSIPYACSSHAAVAPTISGMAAPAGLRADQEEQHDKGGDVLRGVAARPDRDEQRAGRIGRSRELTRWFLQQPAAAGPRAAGPPS
jgi:hypothetical protein